MNEKDFEAWLAENAMKLPAIPWGPSHTKVALAFAKHVCGEAPRSHAETVMRAALTEIAKGAGPFNLDPLKHAQNCIEAMKATAQEALFDSECTPMSLRATSQQEGK